MTELALRRERSDRRRYTVEGVGTMRVGGLIARTADASDLAGNDWHFRRRGRRAHATLPSAEIVGEYSPRAVGRGGTLRWEDRVLALEPTGRFWQERYRLLDGRRQLAGLSGRSWGREPVRLHLTDDAELDPGLVLFVAFVVRGLAEYASQ